MNGWIAALLLVAGAIAVIWTTIDFVRDALLFVTPEETAKRRLHRRLGDGPAYDAVVRRFDARRPRNVIILALCGLIGMAGTAWIIFGLA